METILGVVIMAGEGEHVVDVDEAQARFSELLEWVARGEAVAIVRHGEEIARLLPVKRESSVLSRRKAIWGIREIASRNCLGALKESDLRSEVRR